MIQYSNSTDMRNLLLVMFTMIGLNSMCQNNSIQNTFSKKEYSQETQKTISIKDGKISFVGRYWGSVGYTYEIEYDKEVFNAQSKRNFKHPEKVAAHLCGGDDGTLTFTLKPKKKGEFTVIEIYKFRGQETKRILNTIIVK